jgi:hypothetical protein
MKKEKETRLFVLFSALGKPCAGRRADGAGGTISGILDGTLPDFVGSNLFNEDIR